MDTFGALLSKYRRNAVDPRRGGMLTQERLAELLEQEANVKGYTAIRVSNWERGEEVIRHDNRQLLVGLVQVLSVCGGVTTLDEADTLLHAGDYRQLNEAEMQQINPAWLSGEKALSPYPITPSPPHPVTLPPSHPLTLSPPHPVTPFMVPPLPPQGVFGREQLLTAVFDHLQLNEAQATNVPPLALLGMGGIGKTTLTIAFGRLDRMRQLFPDGILWIVLGPNPTVRLLLENWGRALGLDLLPERDEDACRDRLQEALYSRRALLIVDDVWEIKHGKQFMVAGPHCRTLLTTRESLAAHHLATSERTLKVDLLSPEASLQLLQRLAPQAVAINQSVARRLCERLDYLPLALTLAGRLLANEAEVPGRMQRLVDELLERRDTRLQLLQAEGRLGIDEENPVSLQAILGLSVDRLDETDRQRFAMAAVFGGEPLTWAIPLAAHVWECTAAEAEDTVARFSHRGLVQRREDGRYWMHALLADYAKALMDEMGL